MNTPFPASGSLRLVRSSLCRGGWSFAFAVVLGVALAGTAVADQLIVTAGDSDRRQTVVRFAWPEGARPAKSLRDDQGVLVPVQTDESGRASFVLPELNRGAVGEYQLVDAPAPGAGSVRVERAGLKLKVSVAGRPVLEYQAEPGELPRSDIPPIYQRGGYLHPVFTPAGVPITDNYAANHQHHHGIWSPWTKTEFEGRHPDFWNMGDGKGRVEFVALDRTWAGPVSGGFSARHRFVDLTAGEPRPALNETWRVEVFNPGTGVPPRFLFDLELTQTCATTNALTLLKYIYGGLGFRGHWDWNGPTNTFFLTSEGETDRVQGNATRARWCHIGGLVAGRRAGVTILCHPENFRAPQPMRLNPTEPFFCFAPPQLGDFEIAPGRPYAARYRFIVQDGPPDRAELERHWSDYAHPPEVQVRTGRR